MGWSESYYENMKTEADNALREHSRALRQAIAAYRATMAHYRVFVERPDDIEERLRRMEELLPGDGTARHHGGPTLRA